MATVTTEISAKSNMRVGVERAKEDMRAFRKAVKAEADALKRETQQGAGGKSSKGMLALGNTSNQVADIAVQLESGASAARVVGQQFSQIAAGFGPTGAVLGGVIAVGAGIYSWASNAKEAEDAIKRVETNAQNARAAVAKIEAGTQEDQKTVRINSGRTDAIYEAYQARLKEIDAAEQLVQFDDAAGNAKIAQARASAEAAYQSERTAEAAKEQLKVYGQIDEAAQRTVRARAAIEEISMTTMEKQIKLAREIGALAAKEGKGDALAQEKTAAELAEKRLELIRSTITENDRLIMEQKRANDEVVKGFDEINRQMQEVEKARKQAAEAEKRDLDAIAKKRQQQADIEAGLRQKEIKKQIDREVMPANERPRARSDERREERREKRAERIVISRKREDLKNDMRHGRMTTEEANNRLKKFREEVKKVTNPNAETDKLLGEIKAFLEKAGNNLEVA